LSEPTASTAEAAENRYGVRVEREDAGWRVAILDPGGAEVSSRSCGDEVEARTYASVVRQHIEWLSEPMFRRYYAIAEGS
jgi:hypothetical protein